MEEKEMVAEETAAEEKSEENNTANMAWIDFVTMLEELEYK